MKDTLQVGSPIQDAMGELGTIMALTPDEVQVRWERSPRTAVQGSWMPRGKVRER